VPLRRRFTDLRRTNGLSAPRRDSVRNVSIVELGFIAAVQPELFVSSRRILDSLVTWGGAPLQVAWRRRRRILQRYTVSQDIIRFGQGRLFGRGHVLVGPDEPRGARILVVSLLCASQLVHGGQIRAVEDTIRVVSRRVLLRGNFASVRSRRYMSGAFDDCGAGEKMALHRLMRCFVDSVPNGRCATASGCSCGCRRSLTGRRDSPRPPP